jgi:hypothetical protein
MMYLEELVTIAEKLRAVNIGDEAAQNYLGAAVINLDHAIARARKASQPVAQAVCECEISYPSIESTEFDRCGNCGKPYPERR